MRYLSTVLLLLLSTTIACGSTSRLNRQAADALFPVSEENKLGAQLSVDVEKELKISTDAVLTAYIAELGAKTVKAAGASVPAGIKFTFKVVDDPETVNAFAMPGGHVYFYTGLIKKATSEAEIMAVMTHEVAHVVRRHVAQRLIANYGAQALLGAALGENPGVAGEIAAGIVGNGYLLKHSRDAESDADDVGIRWITKANYSPQGYVSFFEKLASGGGSPPEFLSTHPDPSNRVQSAKDYISKLRNAPSNMGDATRFAAIKSRIK